MQKYVQLSFLCCATVLHLFSKSLSLHHAVGFYCMTESYVSIIQFNAKTVNEPIVSYKLTYSANLTVL